MTDTANKIYFASDFHLGAPDYKLSRQREHKITNWLEDISLNAAEVYLVGDIFDFWFEYKKVIPKGFVRILGKIANLTDNGIKVHIFKGNHDMWLREYFGTELGCEIHTDPIIKTYNSKKFYIGHGDGLGPGDRGYKFLKLVFRAKVNQWLFRWLHPDLGIPLASFFSGKSRAKNEKTTTTFLKENEWLVSHARKVLEQQHIDYFIFGHRHFPVSYKLNDNSTYLNLGDWITHFSYAEYDGVKLQLKKFS